MIFFNVVDKGVRMKIDKNNTDLRPWLPKPTEGKCER